VLARERHLEALREADAAMARAIEALAGGRGAEIAAEDLRVAQSALSRITGEFGADALLGEIFARFCIGK
jgi:tRNA modification GTPase